MTQIDHGPENEPIAPGEMRRRLEIMDARLEGINHHTKTSRQLLAGIFVLAGLAFILFFKDEFLTYWPF